MTSIQDTTSTETRTWVVQLAQLGWLERLYLFFLGIYSACFLPLFSSYQTAESVLVLLFFGAVFFSKQTRYLKAPVLNDPLFRICAALLVFLLCMQIWYAVSLPDYIDPSLKVTRHFLKPFMVLLVAFGLYIGGPQAPWWLLATAATGFAVYLGITFNLGEWSAALSGHRVDFGIHNAQHTAMFFGTSLLALLCFMPRIVLQRTSLKKRIPAIILGVAATLLAVFGTVVSQTRAVWLGLVAAMLVALFLSLMLAYKKRHSPKQTLKVFGGIGVLIIVLTVAGTAGFNAEEKVERRFEAENIDLQNLTEAPLSDANPHTSSSVRLVSWRVAAEWFAERPLLGWGAGVTDALIDHSDYFSERFKKQFGHLHNSFVETLIANGLLGASIILAFAAWIGVATVRAFRTGHMPTDVFVFAWCFLAFWIVINTFESYILYGTGQYLNAIIVGFIYSFYFRSQVRTDCQ